MLNTNTLFPFNLNATTQKFFLCSILLLLAPITAAHIGEMSKGPAAAKDSAAQIEGFRFRDYLHRNPQLGAVFSVDNLGSDSAGAAAAEAVAPQSLTYYAYVQ